MYTSNLRKITGNITEEYFRSLHENVAQKSILGKMLYSDTKSWLPDDLLVKADKMTMAASVEMRAPFLDQELMEFATSLPDHYKLNGKIGKYILKKFMQNKIPDVIISRKKRGFPVPLTYWFRDKLYDRARKLLLNESTLSRGYFQRNYIESLFKNIKNGHDLGRRIFSLVVLEMWHRKYID
jgi:asparagine synthase (glutamine-hydrolysing)